LDHRLRPPPAHVAIGVPRCAFHQKLGTDNLLSISAAHNNDALLKSAISGCNLDVAEASLQRISVKILPVLHNLRY
jgi:hypothetical protein